MVEASNSCLVDVEKSFSFPLGAMSPLWLAFAGAAATGAAYFWMSRWTRPTNVEAQLGAVKALPAPPEAPAVAPVASAMIEAAAAAVEPALDIARTATEAVMHSALRQSAAFAEAFDPVDPVPEPLTTAAPTVEAVADAAVEATESAADATVEIARTTAKAAQAALDDLTRLVGVGPKLAASLAGRGVTSFSQIASWTSGDLEAVDQALDLRGRAVRDAWVAQARRLAEAASPGA